MAARPPPPKPPRAPAAAPSTQTAVVAPPVPSAHGGSTANEADPASGATLGDAGDGGAVHVPPKPPKPPKPPRPNAATAVAPGPLPAAAAAVAATPTTTAAPASASAAKPAAAVALPTPPTPRPRQPSPATSAGPPGTTPPVVPPWARHPESSSGVVVATAPADPAAARPVPPWSKAAARPPAAAAASPPRPPKPPRPSAQALADVRDILKAFSVPETDDASGSGDDDDALGAPPAPTVSRRAGFPPLQVDTAQATGRRRSASIGNRPASVVAPDPPGEVPHAEDASASSAAGAGSGTPARAHTGNAYHLKPLPPAPWRPQSHLQPRTPSTPRPPASAGDPVESRLRYLDLVKRLQPAASPVVNVAPGSAGGADDEPMFDLVLIVALHPGLPGKAAVPMARYRYPPARVGGGSDDKAERATAALVAAIPQFCFPDAEVLQPSEQYVSETFSFLLTDADGSKRFGYCRRLLPPGHGPRLPEVYCIVSSSNAFSLFSEILDVVERHLPHGLATVYAFLQAVAAHVMPPPGYGRSDRERPGRTEPADPTDGAGCGEVLEVRCDREKLTVHTLGPNGAEDVHLHRPDDLLALDHVSFAPLFRAVSVATIASLLASLLLERRVILVSASLTTLSECTHAALALLYPFEWQLVLIPIVPRKLLDYCCSPTPFLIGVLADNLAAVERLPLSETVILNLDTGVFVRNDHDDVELIPPAMITGLETALRDVVGRPPPTTPAATEQLNRVVVDAFLCVMVELMARYRNCFGPDDAGVVRFSVAKFVASRPQSLRKLAEGLSQSLLFQMFIQERERAVHGTAEALSVERRLVQVEIFEQAVDVAEARPERGTSGLLEDVQKSRMGTSMQAMKQRFNQLLARVSR